MHNLSYTSNNPRFSFAGKEFSIQIFTFQNIYELDPKKIEVTEENGRLTICCTGLTWAGGQESADGNVKASLSVCGDKVFVKVYAEHSTEKIRCAKVTVHGLEAGRIKNLRLPTSDKNEYDVKPDGEIFRYPNGFDGLYTPLLVWEHVGGKCSWVRSLDKKVRPKTFAVLPHTSGFDVELIFEGCAEEFSTKLDVPEWEIGCNSCYDQIMRTQKNWIESVYALTPWERRKDVPEWAKKISLILSIHCEHWSGYIFNTYDDICDCIKRFSTVIDMSKVLLYLPGWEGRYYYQYGDFRPEPRLGGKEGFKRLIETAHSVGAHVMPMFMINGANPHTEGFEIWGLSSLYTNPSGYPQVWGSCDWDSSRHYDHNCGFPLNPGAPLWQDHIVGQVNDLIDEYGFDGVFMDLAAVYCNDRRFDVYEGTLAIANRIRRMYPNVLMAGEGWYDALSCAYPLTQPSLSENGDTRWSDRPYAELFDEYNRSFAHLGTGDVVRGSTGVFEFGYNDMTKKVPFRKGIIPTITIVDETIEKGWKEIMDIVEQANQYYDSFVKKSE